MELLLYRLAIALKEHPPKQGRCAVFRRQQHAIASPRQAAVRLVDVHAEVQCRKARELAELLHRKLVERDLIAKPALRRPACGREEAVLRAVSAIHIGMRHAAEEAELAPHLRQRCQRLRQLIIATGLRREERFRQKAEVVRDDQHPARCLRLCRPAKHRRHAFEQRQSQRDTRTLQKATTREGLGDVRGVHGREFVPQMQRTRSLG